jgi:DNA-directed RNA polymerase subunit RPC12/RpoP
MKFITVKESHYMADLAVLKSRLESEGIECRLKNELTSQVLNHIPAMLVELQVLESDVGRVKQIFVETGELPADINKSVCPQCGSEQLKMKISVLKRIQVFFAIMAVALFMNNLAMDKVFKKAVYQCRDCGNEF